MAHVYGLGTLWNMNSLQGSDACSYREGTKAHEAYKAISGCSGPIPIEKDGAEGTKCSHWDELCFQGEVMTGYATDGFQISRMTVASLEDLGYEVDYDGADAYTAADMDPSCVCSNVEQSVMRGNVKLGGMNPISSTTGASEPKTQPIANSVKVMKLGGLATASVADEGEEEDKGDEEPQAGVVKLGSLKSMTSLRPGGRRKRRRLSDDGLKAARVYGQWYLMEKKMKPSANATARSDSIYLADKFVNILYMEDDEVYGVDVWADDV